MLPEFRNEPYLDWSIDENRNRMNDALKRMEAQFGQEYPIHIGGKDFKSAKPLISLSPSDPDHVVGRFWAADAELVDKALAEATRAFESWKRVPGHERARYLLRASHIMRARRLELAACMVHEVGKTWGEADADVCETIDFLDFYGREMIRYSQPQPLTPLPGEENELYYVPLGVGVVIPPWNFPCAIMAGMTAAAIVAGNAVILKPSSDAPMIAHKFYEIMEETRLPAGVFNFVTGGGGSVGNVMIGDKRCRFVAFTGSMGVGLSINELAAKKAEGQIWLKRVVLEMGGKDSIVVDADCHLEDAVDGTVASAFGFQGQKCSACSRVIVDQKIYDAFVEKVVSKVKSLKVGHPRDVSCNLGPVINEAAMKDIQRYIDIGKKEGRLLCGGERVGTRGYFLQPTVIADVDPMAVIAQEEIFGPVLAVIKSRDFDHGLEIANNTMFGLTGGLYSRSRERIERARREFHVGNLYINRKCTGAMVGGHPFGGFNMSGTDSKAGGRDYLSLFTQAKVVSEKLNCR
ncbi:MAG: L-glutamate gamma-semialdehyde dehydrogenase [Candidatus Riflebacteria bacterium]|nr:L-glutamate gamma-semialdehyde dehydrogenase [Candidatus Riflebacteria bacterium]